MQSLLRYLIMPVVMLLATNANASIQVVDSPPADTDSIIDTRNKDRCLQQSFADSYCLPLSDLVTGTNRLPNFSGLLWLWGTVGLTGDENVLVVGESWRQTHLLAALLHISGQKRVSVLNQPAEKWNTLQHPMGKGVHRAMTRTSVYQATMRNDAIILRNELAARLKMANLPALLDGRSEAEYWGTRIRAARGGHLPGAIFSPSTDWLSSENTVSADSLKDKQIITYAHDAVESLQHYSLLVSAGLSVTVYLEGWVGWASEASLPVDAESFAIQRNRIATKPVNRANTGHSEPDSENSSTNNGLSFSPAHYLVILLLLVIILLLLLVAVLTKKLQRSKS